MNIHRSFDRDPKSPVLSQLDRADLDAVTAAADAAQCHLVSGWFDAASPDYRIIGARRSDGSPVIALPLESRKIGPLSVMQLPGSYWPYRSFPIVGDLRDEELAAFLQDPQLVRATGRIWRFGPVYSSDPTATRLLALGKDCGWQVISKSIARCYELDLAAARADGPWPKGSVMRKVRARERKLSEQSPVKYRFLRGAEIDDAAITAMAEVEDRSWLAKLDGGGDTKFLDPSRRAIWVKLREDRQVSPFLFASLMVQQDRPIAFTFGIAVNDRRYYIANNYDQEFAKFGPGKMLLYRDFDEAAREGITAISWGAGDAGYKSDMGATAGPDILDLLLVRGRGLAAILRPIFLRGV